MSAPAMRPGRGHPQAIRFESKRVAHQRSGEYETAPESAKNHHREQLIATKAHAAGSNVAAGRPGMTQVGLRAGMDLPGQGVPPITHHKHSPALFEKTFEDFMQTNPERQPNWRAQALRATLHVEAVRVRAQDTRSSAGGVRYLGLLEVEAPDGTPKGFPALVIPGAQSGLPPSFKTNGQLVRELNPSVTIEDPKALSQRAYRTPWRRCSAI